MVALSQEVSLVRAHHENANVDALAEHPLRLDCPEHQGLPGAWEHHASKHVSQALNGSFVNLAPDATPQYVAPHAPRNDWPVAVSTKQVADAITVGTCLKYPGAHADTTESVAEEHVYVAALAAW